MSEANRQGTEATEVGAQAGSGRKGRLVLHWPRIARLVLILNGLILISWAVLTSGPAGPAGMPLWNLQDSRRLVSWLGALLLFALGRALWFAPLGFLTAASFWPRATRRGRLGNFAAALVFSVFVAMLVIAIRNAPPWGVPGPISMALPSLGCLIGVWIGSVWMRGRAARRLLVWKVAAALLVVVAGAVLLLWLGTGDQPLAFEAAKVDSAEIGRLIKMVRHNNPRRVPAGETRTLRFTDRDLNMLLTRGLSLGSPDRKAQVILAEDRAEFSASIGLPWTLGHRRYLNMRVSGGVSIDDGVLHVRGDSCRIGRIPVPRVLLRIATSVASAELRRNRRSKPFVVATRDLKITSGQMAVTYSRIELPMDFREDLFGPIGLGPEMVEATQAYVLALQAVAKEHQYKNVPFSACIERVFKLAQERSVSRDPVLENRAAIFAMGILLGHSAIEEFVGPVRQGIAIDARAQQAFWRVPIRNRMDWTRHYCVSAAIAILSAEVVSDAAGLLKEELDAGAGGSGFSFCDLLADRAGTTFGLAATRDRVSAAIMQRRIAAGFVVDDFFPPAADLPENLPDAEFQSKYGGVGGEGYKRVVAEIERRISACAAYR